MITMNFFAEAETSAAASAFGVSTKPARISTPSRTTISCASRLATSGATPPVSLRMNSIFLPAPVVTVPLHIELDTVVHLRCRIRELSGIRHDQTDLDRFLRLRGRSECKRS